MGDKPVLLEVASNDKDLFSGYFSYFESVNRILRSEGAGSRAIGGIYGLYNEMEDKDSHLYSVLQTRKLGVLSRSREIMPADNSQQAIMVADFVKEVIGGIKDFEQALFNLLDAVSKGFAVLEIIWDVKKGRVVVEELKSRFQGRFCFDKDNNLCLVDGVNYPYGILAHASVSTNVKHVPEKKFVVFTFNGNNGNPYGNGLCGKAFWHYWFKKNNLKFWLIFNEKFGSPTVIGKYKSGTSEEERDKLMDVVESMQNDTGVIIPENVMIEFLEASRSGSVNSYKDLADWCNDEISKLVIGETLTTSEGRNSGSYALGKIHETVRNEYIEFDAKCMMDVINNQLIPHIVNFNFGSDAPCPKMVIDTSADEDLESAINLDKSLISMGLPLSKSYFYNKYKKPVPNEDERILRYDDNNLYQYHLQFGILTINEVRRSLGLPPVAWGNQPPERYSTQSNKYYSMPKDKKSNEDPAEIEEQVSEN